jgi:hypothetical protein
MYVLMLCRAWGQECICLSGGEGRGQTAGLWDFLGVMCWLMGSGNLGSPTQECAHVTNLFHQPKCCHPHGAGCLGPPFRVWESSHLHHYLCWLLSKNEELKNDHYPVTNTRNCMTERILYLEVLKISYNHRPLDNGRCYLCLAKTSSDLTSI